MPSHLGALGLLGPGICADEAIDMIAGGFVELLGGFVVDELAGTVAAGNRNWLTSGLLAKFEAVADAVTTGVTGNCPGMFVVNSP